MKYKIVKLSWVTLLCFVCAALVAGDLKKNFKILHLLVEHNKSAKPNHINVSRLAKRDIRPGYGPHDFNFTEYRIDPRDFSQINSDGKFRDDILKKIKEESKHTESTVNTYNGIDIDHINYNHHPNSHSFPVKPVAAVFGTVLIVSLVCLIIRFCAFMYPNSTTHRTNSQVNTQHSEAITSPRVNRCGHTSCATNYLTNPSGACRYRDDTSPTAPMIFDPVDVERLRAPNMGNLTTQLDLPPTYSSSVHNSTQNLTNDTTHGFNKKIVNTADSNNSNLPPSYCEAVGYKDHSYNGVASHNHSGQHHREDYGHDHHNATNGFSGNHSSGGDGGGHSGSHGGGDSGSHGGGDSGAGGGGNND